MAIIVVTCRKCHTRFRLPAEAVKPEGTRVRCSRCSSVFVVTPPCPVEQNSPFTGASQNRAPRQPDSEQPAPPAPAQPPQEAGTEKVGINDRPVHVPQINDFRATETAPLRNAAVHAEASRHEHHPSPPERKTAEQPEPSEARPAAGETAPLPGPSTTDPFSANLASAPADEEPLRDPYAEPVEDASPPPRNDTANIWPVKPPTRQAFWRAPRLQPLLLILLVGAVLAVCGLSAHHLGLLGAEGDLQGNHRISFTGVSGFFLKNEDGGVIYVVQGLARNGYDDKRQRIRIRAALLNDARRQVSQTLIYAGNVFTREELQRLPLASIESRLASPAEDGSGGTVRPGGTLAFMAVFSNLPAGLGEFSLEAAGSSRATSS
ncbi:MAG: zinc-ribbon domain-containing protein [Pseudomonadota bacterium]